MEALKVITITLGRSIVPVLELLVPISACIFALSCMASLLFGELTDKLVNFSSAMQLHFEFLTISDVEAYREVYDM